MILNSVGPSGSSGFIFGDHHLWIPQKKKNCLFQSWYVHEHINKVKIWFSSKLNFQPWAWNQTNCSFNPVRSRLTISVVTKHWVRSRCTATITRSSVKTKMALVSTDAIARVLPWAGSPSTEFRWHSSRSCCVNPVEISVRSTLVPGASLSGIKKFPWPTVFCVSTPALSPGKQSALHYTSSPVVGDKKKTKATQQRWCNIQRRTGQRNYITLCCCWSTLLHWKWLPWNNTRLPSVAQQESEDGGTVTIL